MEEEGVSAEGRTEEPQLEVEASRAGEGDEETGIAAQRERRERGGNGCVACGNCQTRGFAGAEDCTVSELEDDDLLDFCEG